METREGHPDHWRQTLELPSDLREPLTELAKAQERSVAGEIRVALREHVEASRSREALERLDEPGEEEDAT